MFSESLHSGGLEDLGPSILDLKSNLRVLMKNYRGPSTKVEVTLALLFAMMIPQYSLTIVWVPRAGFIRMYIR